MNFLFLILFLLIATPSVLSVPINNNTALTIAKGEILIREQLRFAKLRRDPSPLNRTINIFSLPSVLLYGITQKLAIFGIYPLLQKKLRLDTPEGRITRKTTGFGDLTILGKYRFFTYDKPVETYRASLIAGIKFPTGNSQKKDAFGEIPRPIQLGTGSWDFFGGGVFTWQTIKQELDIAVLYKTKTKARGFRFGDSFFHDISYQLRIHPWEFPEEMKTVPSFLNIVIEANGIFIRKNKDQNVTIQDSGGYILFISPGLQYVTKRFIIETSIQLPAIQRLNGQQPKIRYVLVGGFRVLF